MLLPPVSVVDIAVFVFFLSAQLLRQIPFTSLAAAVLEVLPFICTSKVLPFSRTSTAPTHRCQSSSSRSRSRRSASSPRASASYPSPAILPSFRTWSCASSNGPVPICRVSVCDAASNAAPIADHRRSRQDILFQARGPAVSEVSHGPPRLPSPRQSRLSRLEGDQSGASCPKRRVMASTRRAMPSPHGASCLPTRRIRTSALSARPARPDSADCG